MSGLIYCIKDATSTNDVKQLVANYTAKIGLKNLAQRMTTTISDELKNLTSKSFDIDKVFQESSILLSQIPPLNTTETEDDDVLLVGDNFHSIASKELALYSKVFVQKCKDEWHGGILNEVSNATDAISERKYWVRFSSKGRSFSFNSKKIAFADPPIDKLSVGTRVIGMHREGKWCSGVVAEPPTPKNKNRYLVFFDDGYAQYNIDLDIRQVYDQNKCVWEDISGDTSQFIKEYIQQYPNRSMVRLKAGHQIKVEKEGLWSNAAVVEVDCSLVKMMFSETKIEEWIYRGSKRLEPLFNELKKAEASQRLGRAPRFRTDPKLQKRGAYVVYIMQSDDNDAKKGDVELIDLDPEPGCGTKKPVARKSCSQFQNTLTSSSADPEAKSDEKTEPDGFLQNIDRSLIPQGASSLKKCKKVCAKCSPSCIIAGGDDPAKFKGSNPLLIPILCGWERKITKSAHGRKKSVIYTAYCGRTLKNIDDLDQCLMQSDSQLTIDLFSFDVNLNTDQEFIVTKNFCDIKDFSLGKENVPIPCVNSVDRQFPEYIEYSTHRIPGEGVNLNVDSNFLVGCNCTDNCRDRTKCQCMRLTIDATDCIPNGRNPKAGYTNRRLKQPIVTGLYECNENCSCDSRCHNRVIQNGLNLRLQIFKTEQKGWGLRSMDDIPAGGFICVYSGQILTEESANEDGQLYGDEYLADLDHIDVVEKEKEGYESDVKMDVDEEDEDNNDDEDDGDDDADDDDDCLKWLKNYHGKIENVERKMIARRSSKKPPTQTKPVARKFASKKTSNQNWSSKTLVKLKEVKPKNDSHSNRQKREFNDIDMKPVETDSNTQNEGKSTRINNDVSVALNLEISLGNREDENKSPRDDWCDEMYDDLEIEIDENEVLETDDIEEPMSTEINDCIKNSIEIQTKLRNERDKEMEANENAEACPNMDIKNVQNIENIEAADIKLLEANRQTKQSNHQEKDKVIPRKTTRQLYGEDAVYIIDAKSIGNLGRYFNHSCSPNIFVQNIFYDTHDLRFPWVAFFASKLIKAGTELTWNYNYEVGSVPGKKLACHCGSANCNGRLL